MIRVERSRVPAPAVLSSVRARDERQRAETFFSLPPETPTGATAARKPRTKSTAKTAATDASTRRAAEKFSFSVYRDDEIKAHLNHLFHGKCAYCEMRYAATQPMDVEHFRPKGEAADFDGSTSVGYYWLASEWTNLLPSCIDCNRARIHRDELSGKEVRLGKETLFPLVPGTPRAAFGMSIESERPLLLDPCRDRPELYLTFPEGLVVAFSQHSAPPDAVERVTASVRVYGLNRTELVQERRRFLLALRRHFDQIRQLSLALAEVRSDTSQLARDPVGLMIEDLLGFEMATVLEMTEPEAPFSLMALQEVAAFEAELGRGLSG